MTCRRLLLDAAGRRLTVILLVLNPVLSFRLPDPSLQAPDLPIPVVAVHVSELTQALETIPARPPTPMDLGTTGFEWWTPQWHYFVMVESLKEALRSDGTPFVEVSDADISAGRLMTSAGKARFPILVSLASEAIHDNEVASLRGYVAAGGFLLVGSSAFTRHPDGTSRGDFALADEMGLHSATASLTNWYNNRHFSKLVSQRLVSDIPAGLQSWRMPMAAEQIPMGTWPDYAAHWDQKAWQVTSQDSEVIASGSSGPILATRPYGLGRFIYYGLQQPLIGNGGFDVGMYTSGIVRNAIEWAFEASALPIVKVSPWKYPYDAAFVLRHDLENWATSIANIASSAQYESTRGARGDYYFTTGTLRLGSEDTIFNDQQKRDAIEGLRQAVSLYRATIGSHNGGLKNPGTSSLDPIDYFYWHWGPDEALDTVQPGYPTGRAYALASIAASYADIEGWLTGLDNGRVGCGAGGNCPRLWASPVFNSTRDGSFDIMEDLGVSTMGEQKIGPFPHWTLSTQTRGKRYTSLSLPVSEWFGADVIQSMDGHTLASVDESVDFYYGLGALVNVYTHSLSNSDPVTQEYLARCLSKPRMWATNAVGVLDWWMLRSEMTVVPTYHEAGSIGIARAAVEGSTDPESAIEMVIPNWSGGGVSLLDLSLNGAPANSSEYRVTSHGVKVRVGTNVASVEVRYSLTSAPTPTPGTPTATITRTRTATMTDTPGALTATVTVDPGSGFPSTGVLDTFDRSDGAIGGDWGGVTSGYSIASNRLKVGGGDNAIFWRASAYGADQEVYVTLVGVDGAGGEQDLLLKSQSSSTWGSGVLEVLYSAAGHRVEVWTFTNGQGWVKRGADIGVTFANGDRFGARAMANGKVEIYRNGVKVGESDATGWPYYASGGYVGVWYIDAANAVLDDFGGGTVVTGPAPTAVP